WIVGAVNPTKGNRREGRNNTRTRLYPQRGPHVGVIGVECDLLIPELAIQLRQDLIKEPDVAIRHAALIGERVVVPGVESRAVVALTKTAAVVGPHTDPRPIWILPKVVLRGFCDDLDDRWVRDAYLFRDTLATHLREILRM